MLYQCLSFTILVKTNGKYGQVYPKAIVASKHDIFRMFCNSYSTPLWIIHNYLTDHLTRMKKNSYRVSRKITVSPFRGTYRCMGTYKDGNSFTALSYIFVAGIVLSVVVDMYDDFFIYICMV